MINAYFIQKADQLSGWSPLNTTPNILNIIGKALRAWLNPDLVQRSAKDLTIGVWHKKHRGSNNKKLGTRSTSQRSWPRTTIVGQIRSNPDWDTCQLIKPLKSTWKATVRWTRIYLHEEQNVVNHQIDSNSDKPTKIQNSYIYLYKHLLANRVNSPSRWSHCMVKGWR
jgi:hypothetical protein